MKSDPAQLRVKLQRRPTPVRRFYSRETCERLQFLLDPETPEPDDSGRYSIINGRSK